MMPHEPLALYGDGAHGARQPTDHNVTQEQPDQALKWVMWRGDEICHEIWECWSSSRTPQRWRENMDENTREQQKRSTVNDQRSLQRLTFCTVVLTPSFST